MNKIAPVTTTSNYEDQGFDYQAYFVYAITECQKKQNEWDKEHPSPNGIMDKIIYMIDKLVRRPANFNYPYYPAG